MINKENIAIIGLGSIGRRHLRLAREFRSEIKIIAVRSGKEKKVPEEKIADKIVYNIKDAMEISEDGFNIIHDCPTLPFSV